MTAIAQTVGPTELPGHMPRLDLVEAGLRNLMEDFWLLPPQFQPAVYWSVRLMQEARARSLLQSILAARFLALGFVPQGRNEFGFGVIAFTHPPVDPRTSQMEPLDVDNQRFQVLVRPIQLEEHGPQTQPANGTSSCWARTRLASEAVGPGLLTAKHVTNGVIGGLIPLSDGTQGEVLDIGPEGIDVALVATTEDPAARKIPVMRLIPAWWEVQFDGPSGQHQTTVAQTGDILGIYRSNALPLRVILSDGGKSGDSGALVRGREDGAAVGVYLGTGTDPSERTYGFCQHAYQATEIMQMELYE